MCVLFVLYVCCIVCGRIGGDGVVKVSDFGLAAKLNPGHNQYIPEATWWISKSAHQVDGSREHRAPWLV